jgi:hypothetical protein
MKKYLISTICILGLGFVTVAQNVNIPDANFKNALLNHNPVVDTDNDGEISIVEAQAYTSFLNFYNANISDLTGIEEFINLQALHCQINQLTSLDVSKNVALRQLNCWANKITSIDLSSNKALRELNCHNNQLLELDLSSNTDLEVLLCDYNKLRSLNLANGNNNKIQSLNAYSNPNLTCIQVDDVAYSNSNWVNGTSVLPHEDTFRYDERVVFSEDCSATNILQKEVNDMISIYPNPAQSELNIEVNAAINIIIVNALGEIMATQQLNKGANCIDI